MKLGLFYIKWTNNNLRFDSFSLLVVVVRTVFRDFVRRDCYQVIRNPLKRNIFYSDWMASSTSTAMNSTANSSSSSSTSESAITEYLREYIDYQENGVDLTELSQIRQLDLYLQSKISRKKNYRKNTNVLFFFADNRLLQSCSGISRKSARSWITGKSFSDVDNKIHRLIRLSFFVSLLGIVEKWNSNETNQCFDSSENDRWQKNAAQSANARHRRTTIEKT